MEKNTDDNNQKDNRDVKLDNKIVHDNLDTRASEVVEVAKVTKVVKVVDNKNTQFLKDALVNTTSNQDQPIQSLDKLQDISPEDILLNLKIIGCIKKRDRISKNTDNVLEIETNDLFQPLRRWWFGRSRNETISNIKKIITTSFDLTDKTLNKEKSKSISNSRAIKSPNKNTYFDEENSNLLQWFVLEMKNASKGLDNLKNTYSDDTRIVSELDILLEQLALRIEKINGILKIDINSCT